MSSFQPLKLQVVENSNKLVYQDKGVAKRFTIFQSFIIKKS